MEEIKFISPEHMLDVICDGQDLYCPEKGMYIYLYNDSGSVCFNTGITETDARELEDKAHKKDEYWSAYMTDAGEVIDSPEYLANNGEEVEGDPRLEFFGEIWEYTFYLCGPRFGTIE